VLSESFFDALERELRSVVRRRVPELKRYYESAGDPRDLGADVDSIVAAVIEEFESAGYVFGIESVRNVELILGRPILGSGRDGGGDGAWRLD
jgi:hypothetical protein